jgi:hypothetical protein
VTLTVSALFISSVVYAFFFLFFLFFTIIYVLDRRQENVYIVVATSNQRDRVESSKVNS